MNGCNCCVAGATPTPDIADPCVCNAGKGAVFVGSTGKVFVRTVLTNPCVVDDWEYMSEASFFVQPSNTCNLGGIGATYAVRQAILTDETLVINGAPEHYSMVAHGDDLSSGPQNPAPASSQAGFLSLEVEVTNPSACRNMPIIIVLSGATLAIQVAAGANGEYGTLEHLTIDGGPDLLAAQQTNATLGFASPGPNCDMSFSFSTVGNIAAAVLAPGQTATILYTADLVLFTLPSDRSKWTVDLDLISMTVFGSTTT